MNTKVQPTRAQEGQRPTPAAPPVVEPRYRVALCLEECVVCLGLGTNQIFGGEWVTDQQHVALIAHDPHFKIVEGTRAETDAAMAEHAATVKKMTAEAKALGMSVTHHGQFTVARRR